jgi:hypothetical protein
MKWHRLQWTDFPKTIAVGIGAFDRQTSRQCMFNPMNTVCVTESIFIAQAGRRFLHEIHGAASANSLPEESQFREPEVCSRGLQR